MAGARLNTRPQGFFASRQSIEDTISAYVSAGEHNAVMEAIWCGVRQVEPNNQSVRLKQLCTHALGSYKRNGLVQCANDFVAILAAFPDDPRGHSVGLAMAGLFWRIMPNEIKARFDAPDSDLLTSPHDLLFEVQRYRHDQSRQIPLPVVSSLGSIQSS